MEFEMRQDFRRGTPANLTIFCIPHCWICSLISVDFVRELSHFRAIALTSYTLYGTLIRYWRTKIRRRASDVHLHLSLLGYYSGTGKMRNAENHARVKCGMLHAEYSAFYPLHIFRIFRIPQFETVSDFVESSFSDQHYPECIAEFSTIDMNYN